LAAVGAFVAGALRAGLWWSRSLKKKVELPLGLSRRVHLRHVLFCFDALILWIG